MENEAHDSLPQSARFPASMPGASCDTCRIGRLAGLGLLGLTALIAGYLLFRDTAPNGSAQDPADKPPSPMFIGWGKPDLAIVVSGQMHGYLQPCGCSHPQYGGLTRRYNFIQALKDKGWPLAAVDLGEIAQASGPQQMLKYRTAMQALGLMGYQAIGIGKQEFLMPLPNALAEYSINHEKPRPVTANLAGTDSKGELFYDMNVRKYEVLQAATFQVGVLGAVGPASVKEIVDALGPNQQDVKFVDKTAPNVLSDLGKRKVDVNVLLYQGLEKEAMVCAEQLHQHHEANPAVAPVQVVLCLTREEEPPGVPIKDAKFPKTSIISIGHKGSYVGVVGVWRTKTGLDFKYQLVSMGPELETKENKVEGHPVMKLMEKYAEQVRDGNFLARYPRSQHKNHLLFKAISKDSEVAYVGSEACKNCHAAAYKVWKESGHAHAFTTLEKAVNPKQRQFDGECVACHTVGYQVTTGYNDPPAGSTPAQSLAHNKSLRHVGCESCHGPAADHVASPKDPRLYPIINPFSKTANPKLSEKARLQQIDDFCQKCHDIENDVHWGSVSFQQKWNKIIHMNPNKNP